MHQAWRIVVIVLAVLLQLVVGFFTLATGLLAPLWAIVVFGLVWLGAVFVLVRLARRRPQLSPLVPLGNALLLWAGLAAGDVLLGWTA